LTTFPMRRFLWIGAAVALVAAAGCANSTGRGSLQAHTSLSSVSAGNVRSARPIASAEAAGRFPASFIGITAEACGVPCGPGRLALYSSANGRTLQFLTAALPGGGVSYPVLSADGRTVAFQRGQGTCAATIDTDPAAGGRERVLIPMAPPPGRGAVAVIPWNASYSGDGRYLLYDTLRCSAPLDQLLHLRNLRTGRELARPGFLTGLVGSTVFVNHDRQVAYAVIGGSLVVRQVPSLTEQTYPPPRNCRYQALAGTETRLVAVLQCGTQQALSLVDVSPHRFTMVRTLIRLGSCLGSMDLSLAADNPSAMLVETYDACRPPQRAYSHILEIRDHTVRLVRSGLNTKMPRDVIW